MEAQADYFEQLAIGVVDECSNDDHHLTRVLLQTRLHFTRELKDSDVLSSAISLAVAAKRADFLSHPTALTVLDQLWYGEIEQQSGIVNLCLTAFFPLLLIQNTFCTLEYTRQSRTGNDHHCGAKTEGRLRRRQKLRRVYSSSIVKFVLDIVSHVILLVLFSIVALSVGRLPRDMSNPWDIWLLFWFVALTMDELWQLGGRLNNSALGIVSAMWSYVDPFNVNLLVSTALYWTGSAMRVYGGPSDIMLIKFVYGISVAMTWLRSFRFYTKSITLGPKLVMLTRMVPDILTFMALFVVFMMTYGVFLETVLATPNAQFGSGIFAGDARYTSGRVMYRPFFQMLGELFLDDIMEDTTCSGPEPFQGCDYHALLVPATGVYCIIVNIVLVNLLIAMMARTYESVQEQTNQIWNLDRHLLLQIYNDKPVLPTPLSVIPTVYKMFVHVFVALGLCKKPTNGEGEAPDPPQSQRELWPKNRKGSSAATFLRHMWLDWSGFTSGKQINSVDWRLEMWQEKNTNRFLEMRAAKNKPDHGILVALAKNDATSREGMKKLAFELKHLQTIIAHQGMQLHKLNTYPQPSETSSWNPELHFTKSYPMSTDRMAGVYNRFEDLEFSECKSGGITLHCALDNSSTVHGTSEGKDPKTPLGRGKSAENMIVLFGGEFLMWRSGELNQKSLSVARLPDGKEALRQDVDNATRRWDQTAVGYAENVSSYTSPWVLYFSTESDIPNLHTWAESPDVALSRAVRLKLGDGGDGTGGNVEDTVMLEFSPATSGQGHARLKLPGPSSYDLDLDGFPLNPVGRTGLRGRGRLGKWGPNRAHHYLIRRTKRDLNNTPIQRHHKPLDEVLLCQCRDGSWKLPGGFVDEQRTLSEDGIPTTLEYKLVRRMFGLGSETTPKTAHMEVERVLHDTHNCEQWRLQCPSTDERDTDNAWVDNRFYEIDLSELDRDYITSVDHPAMGWRFDWVTLHSEMVMANPSHRDALAMLATKKKSHW